MAGGAGVFTGNGVTVIMDPPPVVYAKVFYAGSSPERYLRRQTQAVARMAAELAPKKSGRLSSSIRVDQNRNERGQYAFGFSVYTPVYYGHYVHEGTGPSVRSVFPGAMVFPGTGRYFGTTVFTEIVRHPGTPARPFLRDALVAMVN